MLNGVNELGASTLAFDEVTSLERALLVARRLEREHQSPIAKGRASDVAYSIEMLCELLLPHSHRVIRRSNGDR
jgi:hypothetical protein